MEGKSEGYNGMLKRQKKHGEEGEREILSKKRVYQ
jgi:hypothetical protein